MVQSVVEMAYVPSWVFREPLYGEAADVQSREVYGLVCIGMVQSMVEMAYVPSWVLREPLYGEAADVRSSRCML